MGKRAYSYLMRSTLADNPNHPLHGMHVGDTILVNRTISAKHRGWQEARILAFQRYYRVTVQYTLDRWHEDVDYRAIRPTTH